VGKHSSLLEDKYKKSTAFHNLVKPCDFDDDQIKKNSTVNKEDRIARSFDSKTTTLEAERDSLI